MRYTIDNLPVEGGLDFSVKSFVPRTLQNAKNLLMTRMGEVPYDRYRGFDPAIFDLPLARLREELLPELDRVMLWEPDCEVVDAEAYVTEDGATVITCTVEIGGEANG